MKAKKGIVDLISLILSLLILGGVIYVYLYMPDLWNQLVALSQA